jgi:beta-galactosidase/beta-glucuronidase
MLLFNDGWEFAKSSLDVTDCDGLPFNRVDLPHDWLIYNTLNLYENSIGWYRKRFSFKKEEADQVLLCFDGVYMNSSLYVNHQFIGEWKYGYSSFDHEITDALEDGENEILVKVVHESPNSRWYSGAGIYRNVWIKKRDHNHIVTDGIYVSTYKKKDNWQVEVDVEVNLFEDSRISHSILYNGEVIAAASAVRDLLRRAPARRRAWHHPYPGLGVAVLVALVIVVEQLIISIPPGVDGVSGAIGRQVSALIHPGYSWIMTSTSSTCGVGT